MSEHTVTDAEPTTDRVHQNSWSANLERPVHADDRERLLDDAIDAVTHTAPGYHVNLVTHADQGHPHPWLCSTLEDEFGDRIEKEYVKQCGCGGHVVRVRIRDE